MLLLRIRNSVNRYKWLGASPVWWFNSFKYLHSVTNYVDITGPVVPTGRLLSLSSSTSSWMSRSLARIRMTPLCSSKDPYICWFSALVAAIVSSEFNILARIEHSNRWDCVSKSGFCEHCIGNFISPLFIDTQLFLIPFVIELLKLKRRYTVLLLKLGLSM